MATETERTSGVRRAHGAAQKLALFLQWGRWPSHLWSRIAARTRSPLEHLHSHGNYIFPSYNMYIIPFLTVSKFENSFFQQSDDKLLGLARLSSSIHICAMLNLSHIWVIIECANSGSIVGRGGNPTIHSNTRVGGLEACLVWAAVDVVITRGLFCTGDNSAVFGILAWQPWEIELDMVVQHWRSPGNSGNTDVVGHFHEPCCDWIYNICIIWVESLGSVHCCWGAYHCCW